MNKRKVMSSLAVVCPSWVPIFGICAVAFLFGAVAGTGSSSAFYKSDAAGEILTGYFLSLKGGETGTDLASLFWWLAKYHVFVFLLGFSMLGVVGIPLAAFARGFTLSFTMAVLVRLYSVNGAIAGALILGVSSLFSVPLFFLMAVSAMNASLELTRSGLFLVAPSGFGIYSRPYFIRSIVIFLLLVILAIGERAILSYGLSSLPIFL